MVFGDAANAWPRADRIRQLHPDGRPSAQNARARTALLRPFPSAVRTRDLPRRDLILEIVRIEAVESAFARFRLWIHEKTDRRAVRTGQSDIVCEIVCQPVHLPGPAWV